MKMEIRRALVSDHQGLRVLQLIVYGSVILYFGRTIFIPLSFAALVSFVLYPICLWMERKGVGRLTSIMIAVILLVMLALLLIALLVQQFLLFVDEWPALQTKITGAIDQISQMIIDAFGISRERQRSWMTHMADQSGSSIFNVLQNMIGASAASMIFIVLVPVYAVLILYYRQYWIQVLYRLFPSERRENLSEIITLTIKAYYNFIKGMGVVYLIVGALNSVGLLLLGVPHAILFGLIASILTFIPYIGIIVGSLLPIAIAWLTYDSLWYPLGIVGIFAFVQYLEANIIFPVAVSQRLNVNTLVMLLAIFTGGLLWGVAGMILFVPFTGIAKLIADHNPKLKTLSMILGMSKKP